MSELSPGRYGSLALLAVALLHGVVAAATYPPEQLSERLQQTRLDPESAVWLSDVDIEMGPALLHVQRGVLVPARIADDGQPVELVFVGQARFRLDPPDEIESGQLELFTGERSMDAAVDEAVLVLANEQAMDGLLQPRESQPLRPELVDRIRQVHDRWLNGTERRQASVDASMFKWLIGDPAYSQYFAIWGSSFELGDFLFELDPDDIEQVTLASFRRQRLIWSERVRLKHEIRVQQRKGRFLNRRVEDIGSWDVWVSMSWVPSSGATFPGSSGFETEHYELDVDISRRRRWLDAVATLQLRSEQDGRRVLSLEIMNDLVISSIVDDGGRNLPFYRSGTELVVVLAEPSIRGERLQLSVTYSGRALDWVRGKTYDLRDTVRWYPHCGTVDRATYDVKLTWPAGQQILASGKVVESGRHGRARWERRQLKAPSIAFSFALGRYEVEQRDIGGIQVTLGVDRSMDPRVTEDHREATMDTVAATLAYFQEVFGEYPLDHMTLVTVPRPYSQSFLGFVTLAESVVKHPDPSSQQATWLREATVAHEMAHQWWGNVVGWWSYRDQWLSEGMANYSALLFDSHHNAEQATDRLTAMSIGWKQSLGTTTLEGRTIESLGPIVLGNRLNSSRARNGYRAIVYRKGAVVLAMMARVVGEERFIEMLGALTSAAANRVMTTDAFVKAVERMSQQDLHGFARQFVYGTGIPEVYYGYDSEVASDGNWRLAGEARLLSTPRYRHSIARGADGPWQVRRELGQAPGEAETSLLVPYRLTLRDGGDPSYRSGQLELHGRNDGFAIETDQEPVDLRLDPEGAILAWFFAESLQPKRVMRYEAERLVARGRLEEAEARFRDALAAPAGDPSEVDPLGQPINAPRVDARVENLRIDLGLARIEIEQGRLDQARERLDRIHADLDPSERRALLRIERDVLRSRIELGLGDFNAAQKRLKKTLRLVVPRHARGLPRNLRRYSQLAAERTALAEGFALLAISAWETESLPDFQWAMREARDRGVDVRAFASESGTSIRELLYPGRTELLRSDG